ncbi:hypothetical protein E2562_015227 [Oryza meyeriana var. granulata]|uniref:MADS-box domain-containing protein n=1 Tax=Oryza meyeriana var. granulata TaxID=110450 RepID=A0A6G1EX19_9ORYZ|nr:hypothetical protein E2562_015227 [Oryza meyeriana var. granulata]
MARRKIPMSLIADRRVRATTYVKRKKGLMKKAGELSTLCGVPVALEGLLAKYLELPPEVRAQHTHRRYLEGELSKERAKLARHIPPCASDAVVPVGYVVSSGGGNQMQTTPAGDDINYADQYGSLPWYEFQPQVMQPGHGFQCTGGRYVDMDGYLWQDPGNANVHHGWSDQATRCTDESCSCNAAAPDLATWCTDESCPFLGAPAQPLVFSTGADFVNAPNDFLSMGIGGGFINAGDYSAQCSADGFQLGDANHLDQMHYLVGGTGGAEPSDTQSQNWGR